MSVRLIHFLCGKGLLNTPCQATKMSPCQATNESVTLFPTALLVHPNGRRASGRLRDLLTPAVETVRVSCTNEFWRQATSRRGFHAGHHTSFEAAICYDTQRNPLDHTVFLTLVPELQHRQWRAHAKMTSGTLNCVAFLLWVE